MKNPSPQYYVAIGASAGGLEALEVFFKNMPADSNLIIIIIQHLSPDYKSFMKELLAKHTKIPVHMAEDGMSAAPNNIYLIPPQKNLSIFKGNLFLETQPSNIPIKHPVDIFFRSLAKDQEKNAIGIILTGTGTDGALGVKSIKEFGGMVMVQDPDTSKFDGMPKSAIDTGLVDYILPVGDIPKELLVYTQNPADVPQIKSDEVSQEYANSIAKMNMIIRDYCGIDFSHYKASTISRRMERRIKINKFKDLEQYIEFLGRSDKEKEILHRELLIGVTSFFRDKEAFESLSKKVLQKMDFSKDEIRIWVAACSTGEEAYSIAILLYEYMEKNNIRSEVKIFATDVDKKSVTSAGVGYYPDSVMLDIEPELLDKHFARKDDGYIVKENIRKMIVFATHNVLKDPSFSKLDLVTCRNLFIYFKSEQQQKVLETFYYSLNPNGFLFLGNSESVGEMSSHLKTIDVKWKIFQKKEGYNYIESKSFRSQGEKGAVYRSEKKDSLHSYPQYIKFDRLLSEALSVSMPPSLILDSEDNIVHIINNVSKYIETQPGRFSKKFNSNMKRDLAIFVNNLLRRLKSSNKDEPIETVSVVMSDESLLTVKGYLIEIFDTSFFLISFIAQDSISSSGTEFINYNDGSGSLIKQLESELLFAKEGLQDTVEELETSNEELQSSNEELIAANEELQSTNEELQSVNEELYTVNNEHQSKIEELVKLNNDLNNLIKNTSTGALYLDKTLCIRKITPIVTQITNIRETDVGRPISHLSVIENYPDILKDINSVLENLKGIEKEIIDKNAQTWLTLIKPYRTEFNSVDGIILTFVNITNLKKEEENLRETQSRLNRAMLAANIAWWEYDVPTGKVLSSANRATMIGYTVEEFPDNLNDIFDLIHTDDRAAAVKKMEDHIAGLSDHFDALYRIKRKDGSYSWYHDKGKICEWDFDNKPLKVIGTVTDITHLKDTESEMQNYKDEHK